MFDATASMADDNSRFSPTGTVSLHSGGRDGAVAAAAKGGERGCTTLFGLSLRKGDLEQVAREIVASIDDGDSRHRRYAFVNAHCCNVMWSRGAYRHALESADGLLPDGAGIRLAARLHGEKADNLNGTDLFPHLCLAARDAGRSIFLLGARPGVAERVARAACALAPGLSIAGTHHGYLQSDADTNAVIDAINASGADILLVAMGVPMQDEWLAQHHPRLRVGASFGVGGCFDFFSGRIPRAPRWMRAAGLEWTYRLYQEPGRMFRRYVLGNPWFVAQAAARAAGHRWDASRWSGRLKRAVDFLGAAAGLTMLAPLFAAVAVAIRLDSRGPVFFRQTRIGASGKPFQMLKFRSMYVDAEARRASLLAQNERGDTTSFKMRNDPRITRVGRLLRRASLDELPQLINILLGDMSIVGPRPALPREVSFYSPHALGRLHGKPGLTCIWQVSGRALIGFDDQVEMDLDYLRRQSLGLDLSILMRTLPAVVSGRGAM
jgi:exopolysaccharide biosynthesis WecB/TagA/CpsF family protein